MKKIQPAELFLQIFYVLNDPILWIIYIFTALIVITSLYYFQQFEKFKGSIYKIAFKALAHIANTSQPYNIKNTAHRIIFGGCALAAVIHTIVYSTFVLKIQKDPYVKREIRTVDDILSNDIKLFGNRYALSLLQQQLMVIFTAI